FQSFLSCPEQLRKLEADGEVILLGRLLEQQEIEHQVLSSTAVVGTVQS
ncbi:Uncharacterized protein ALO79_02297, partial [Pseudomonas syringae pv. castaneae]